jgi:hypothetical protein
MSVSLKQGVDLAIGDILREAQRSLRRTAVLRTASKAAIQSSKTLLEREATEVKRRRPKG